MAKKPNKKPQALKFDVITESELKILAEIDGVPYNNYIEDFLKKKIEKASEVLMRQKNIDLYSLAKKRCESATKLKTSGIYELVIG